MKSLFRYKHWFALTNAIIIFIAIVLRLPFLETFPPSMLQDEAATGFNAVSIAATGSDEWGTRLPTIFKSFGDNKPPLYIYVTALIYKVVGWTPILPRLASAVAGILLVLVTSLWLKQIFKSSKLALIGALIVAVSPWTIYLSRMGLESNLGLLFFTSGLLFLEYAKEKKSFLTIGTSSVFFILSAYSYHSYRFITGVFLFSLVLFKIIGKKVNKEIIPLLLIFVISSIGILPGVLSGGSLTRFQQTTVIQPEEVTSIFAYFRGTCHLMSADLSIIPLRPLCSLLWNQTGIKIGLITQSVVNHLSPEFLFFKGDSTLNRNPTSQGEFSVILYPLFLIGFLMTLIKKEKYYAIIIGLIIATIPSILTGPPHAIRLSAQIPFVILMIVLGFKQTEKYLRNISIIIVVILIPLSIYSFVKYGIVVYSESGQFLGQSKQISQTAYRYYEKGYSVFYDQEILPEPHIFFAFWNNLNPLTYQNENKIIHTDEQGFLRPSQIGERLFFYRPDINQMICNPSITTQTLFITTQSLPFIPDEIIYNNTKVYKLAALYDLQSIRNQTIPFRELCK